MLAAQLRNAGRSLLRNGRSIATSPAARGLDELIVTVPKEAPQPVGRAWLASELRLKSWNELHGLWYVLLKERTRLHAEKAAYKAEKKAQHDPLRFGAVRLSMNRIKQVMSERARTEHDDPEIKAKLKAFINAL